MYCRTPTGVKGSAVECVLILQAGETGYRRLLYGAAEEGNSGTELGSGETKLKPHNLNNFISPLCRHRALLPGIYHRKIHPTMRIMAVA